MDWTYVIVAITFMVIGFVLCALLSANKIDNDTEYISIEEILKSKEEENEDEDDLNEEEERILENVK